MKSWLIRIAGSCAVSVSLVLGGAWPLGLYERLALTPERIMLIVIGVCLTNSIAIVLVDALATSGRLVANGRRGEDVPIVSYTVDEGARHSATI